MTETSSTASSSNSIIGRLEGLPISRWHVLIFIVCALTLLCDAGDQYLIISIAPQLIHEWGITAATIGLIVGATGIGGIVGALAFGPLADRIGRRKCIILSIAIYSVITGFGALAQNATQLIIVRALAGVGLGGIVPVVLAYVGEYSPPKWRGRTVAWWNSMFAFGISLAGVVGLVVIVPYGWRWGFVAGASPIVLIIFVLWLPESVRYLVANNRLDEAKRTIERIERSVLGHEKAAAIANSSQNIFPATDAAIGIRQTSKISGWRALKLMAAPSMRSSMLASAVLWFLPSAILLSQFFGVFLTHSKGMNLKAAIALVTATSVFGPLGQFLAGFMSDWVGRKATITVALCFLGTMPLAAFGMVTSASMIYLCLALIWISMSALYGAAFGYTAEQLPTELRGGGLGIFEGLRRTGNAVGPAIIGLIYARIGLTPVLWYVLFACLFTIVVILALGKETRGKPMVELTQIAEARSSA